MPPDTKKGGPAATNRKARPSTQQGTNDIPTVQRAGQTSLPIVEGLLFIGGPDRRTADVIVPECLVCDRAHRHVCPVPAPALTGTKRPSCGACYQVMPKRPKVSKRGRRVRAVA